jgi:hypothetical protein
VGAGLSLAAIIPALWMYERGKGSPAKPVSVMASLSKDEADVLQSKPQA